MSDVEECRKRFTDSLVRLRLAMVRAHGSPEAVPTQLRDAYLDTALSGLALAGESDRVEDDLRTRVRVLTCVRVLDSR